MDQKQQIAEKLKQATNILVTVSNNPTVDQLASCIGLTLALNKMGKHATAVFSGKVPSTIEFLQPEKTFEGNIDSLRDFIISLDKTKADKLRYKVEDTVVKIFITPYHTTLSDKDLEFSQGDFNVDAVVALGVIAQADIDQAISVHGRILHDAATVTINSQPGGDFGSLHWMDQAASSLCELAADLVHEMDKQALDEQIATALLTGIVAETNRFSNSKTTPLTMSISAMLMAAGANQQLVVTKLEETASLGSSSSAVQQTAPGEIQINRQADGTGGAQTAEHTVSIGGGTSQAAPSPAAPPPAPEPSKPPEPPRPEEASRPVSSLEDLAGPATGLDNKEPELARIRIDEQGSLQTVDEAAEQKEATTDPTLHMGGSRMILQPPTMGDGSSGLVSSSYGDPLAPKVAEPASLQPPAGAPAPAPVPAPAGMAPPLPYTPPATALASSPVQLSPSPPLPPLGVPPAGPIGPPALAAPTDLPLGVIPGSPAHVDHARGALDQAFGGVPVPPAPSAPVQPPVPPPSAPNIPPPTGPPPPVPPPMVPPMPR